MPKDLHSKITHQRVKSTCRRDNMPFSLPGTIQTAKSGVTEYIDIYDALKDTGEREKLVRLQRSFQTKRKIVVISGAGISTNAGSKLCSFILWM
jgi:hypothetical protein